MLGVPFLIVIAIFITVHFIKRWKKFYSMIAKIPSVKGQIPFIGIASQFMGADEKKFFQIVCEENEEEFNESVKRSWFGPEIIVLVNTPEYIKAVFNSKECLDKPYFEKISDFSKGLIFGHLDYWQNHRKVLNPAFSIKVLKGFIKIFDDQSKKLVDVLKTKCDGTEIDIFRETSALFLESVLATSLNLEVDIVGNESLKREIVESFDM